MFNTTRSAASGVSTGACVGHVGPEALAGGPIGKLRDGDTIEIVVDREELTGTINVGRTCDGTQLSDREMHPEVRAHPQLPADTRLWAKLQQASGGTWAGAIYDVDRIVAVIDKGLAAMEAEAFRS